MTLNVILCPFVETPIREPLRFVRRERTGSLGRQLVDVWSLEGGLALSVKSARKTSLLWVLKEEIPVVLGVVHGRDSTRCPPDSRHVPAEVRGCIGEETACSSGGESEILLFEEMAFFEGPRIPFLCFWLRARPFVFREFFFARALFKLPDGFRI